MYLSTLYLFQLIAYNQKKNMTQLGIECFMAALKDFKKDHEKYLINRKQGVRPLKTRRLKCN